MRSDAGTEGWKIGACGAALFLLSGVLRELAGTTAASRASYALLHADPLFTEVLSAIGVGISWGPVLLSSILGGVTMAIAWALSERLGKWERIGTVSLVALSPGVLRTYSTMGSESLALTLLALVLYLHFRRLGVGAMLCAAVLGATHAPFAAVAAAFLTLRWRVGEQRMGQLLALVIGWLMLRPPFFPNLQPWATVAIAELGGSFGVSAMVLLMALLFLPSLWRQRNAYMGALLLAGLVLLAGVWPSLVVPGAFGIAALAAIGITRAWQQHWMLQGVKQLTAVAVICGMLFSTIGSIVALVGESPQRAELQGLQVLPPGATVFADIENAELIAVLTGAQVADAPPMRRLRDRLRETDNPRIAAELLREGNITLLYLTPAMHAEYPWSLPGTLERTETFKNLYRDQGISVWELR